MEWAFTFLRNIIYPNNDNQHDEDQNPNANQPYDPLGHFQRPPPVQPNGNEKLFKPIDLVESNPQLEQYKPQDSIESSNEPQLIEISDEGADEQNQPNPFSYFSASSGEVQEVKNVKKKRKSSSKNKKNSKKKKKQVRKKTEIVESTTDEKLNAKTVDEDIVAIKIVPNKKRTKPDEEFEYSPKLKAQKVSVEAVSPSNHIQLPTILLENWAISPDSLQIDEKSFLGGGSFGLVKKGLFHEAQVAVKILECHDNIENLKKEANFMHSLHHPNIVVFYGICAEKHCLVMELCESSLEPLIGKIKPKRAIEIGIQVASGMIYLHNRNITHRDLKPANILMNRDTPKLTDFGISKNIASRANNTKIGTPYYMAPEMFKGNYGPEVDVYAFALILYELISGKSLRTSLFHSKDAFQVMHMVTKANTRPAIPRAWPQELKRLLANMWSLNPEDRPSFEKVHKQLKDMKDKNPFFND